ncbi:hypothetical protein Agabi119p4_3417 [Agaricus bisporus var. burnettii]|uniref:Uncharacterized protein n=1 Tax=Agaricus bisporus var. burnettii TaxID=192524 RepID=A0A8H7F717_AGABI|nr:hypothetical protein Agabi119p4_3417 [Agaricus bisporus var. burnettii]
MADASALERSLCGLTALADDDQLWPRVEQTSHSLANLLRSNDGPVDNRTVLGQTSLTRSIKQLLSRALEVVPVTTESKAAAALELIRVVANLCIDNDENRSQLFEVNVIETVFSLLEAYAEKFSLTQSSPAQISISELKLIRTALGALNNACLGNDEIKKRLNSLEAIHTILRLLHYIYPVGAWITIQRSAPEITEEDWDCRSTVSNWGWKLVNDLKDIKNEAASSSDVQVLPLITPPLAAFTPPAASLESSFFSQAPLLSTLVANDIDVLEEVCTMIESLVLDTEDVRLALARGFSSPAEHSGRLYLAGVKRLCPGGPFVYKMVQWIKAYVEEAGDSGGIAVQGLRDDMVIAAALSLGNLAHRSSRATILFSPPYSLAPVLASPLFLSSGTDLKLKHAILAFLKNLALSANQAPIVYRSLREAGLIQQLSDSGIWNDDHDSLGNVVQVNAIAIAKHLCIGDVEHTFALVIPQSTSVPSGLEQIFALVKRTQSIQTMSEGSRALVNVIRSLWSAEPQDQAPSPERQRNRLTATTLVLSQDSADILATLLSRSGRFPTLVNESILALILLSMHYDGAQLVLRALTKPNPEARPPLPEPVSTSPTSDLSSPVVASPKTYPQLHIPRHALDMLVFVLRNVDNPANYQQEIRINVCALLLQLTKNTPEEDLAQLKRAFRSPLEKLTNKLQSATDKDAMLRENVQKVLSAWA